MENSREFDGDSTSEVIDEPFPATEASPPLEDTEVSSPPSEFSTTRRMNNEARFRQAVGEDGSMQKEAHVRRRVRKDGGEDEEDAGAKQEKSSSRAKDTIYSTILVSVAIVAVVGAVIAKIALARKVLRGA